MNWYDITGRFHEMTFSHECRLSSLPEEWQRELAAIWRLEADVNNCAYLQFLSNWGRESYVYASQGLKKIHATKMAAIVDRCQALVDEHFNFDSASERELRDLMPNRVIGITGESIKEAGSILPDSVIERIDDLSFEFMKYPEDLARLGLQYYGPYLQDQGLLCDTGRDRPTVGRVQSLTGLTVGRCVQFCLWLLGWVCLAIGGQCLRTGRDDRAILAIISGVGSLYLSRRIARTME